MVVLHDAVVAVLDQQPVLALAAGAVALHADQHPSAAQTLALQDELEFAGLQRLLGIDSRLRRPVAPVPQHDRTAAILPLGDGSLEIAVVQRMVLGGHGETLVGRIARGPAGDGPGLEHPVQLQPEVVVQTRGRVFLDHEAQALRPRHRLSAGRFAGLFEVPHLAVAGELLGHVAAPVSWPGPAPRARQAPSRRPGRARRRRARR